MGAGVASGSEFHARDGSLSVTALAAASALADGPDSLRGRSVLIVTDEQLPTAVAMLELDGIARRIVLCTPELSEAQLDAVAALAAADAVVTTESRQGALPRGLPRFLLSAQPRGAASARRPGSSSEWVLLTSGTTGLPKAVLHTLDSLAGVLPVQKPAGSRTVWCTFYDIRRYGGLQIYLRAVRSGAPLVLSSAGEAITEFLERAAAAGVTHVTGTPSHWRQCLMSGAADRIRPHYVRLSGEIADQSVLDGLRAAYPAAEIVHAFASTEAGVAFEVTDGRAGFPATLLARGSTQDGIDLKVQDGTLRIRSRRVAARYLGDAAPPLLDPDGFVDTGDLLELVADRYHFRGRAGGVINVGGLKVYPEEVEAALNADARVRMSLVRARRNPITGAVVVADVVLTDGVCPPDDADCQRRVSDALLLRCRQALPAHKVPALLRIVPHLQMTAAGKLVRPNA